VDVLTNNRLLRLPIGSLKSGVGQWPLARQIAFGALTMSSMSRRLRERRAHGKVVLTVVLDEDELAEIARAGYVEAASTDRKGREASVSLFLSDAVWIQ
jgi:hypothetical protein